MRTSAVLFPVAVVVRSSGRSRSAPTIIPQPESPGITLATVASGAIALLLLSANSTGTGTVAGWALLSIGLMNSIMFPTIFGLASEGLGNQAAEGSGVIATAIVGGAVVPLLTGALAVQRDIDRERAR